MQPTFVLTHRFYLTIGKACFIALQLVAFNAFADGNDEANDIQYKLTVSQYSAKQLNATDINLRAKFDQQSAWLAYYSETPADFKQARAGYERIDKWSLLKADSTIQVADYGFIGGAVTLELGGALHAIVGYGRTNLKPYDNINFDPNDSITYGAGFEFEEGKDIALYRVKDDRVMPGQQIDHLLLHYLVADANKLTLDIFNKSGPADADGKSIAGTGAAISDEWARYFVRLAYDPKVNFTQKNMSRISLGFYF
ncbi:MAG: hypothetical protein ACAH07_02435 [Methylophilaceae bacterium]|nr:hypothetical protein [Methyloradius sp.]